MQNNFPKIPLFTSILLLVCSSVIFVFLFKEIRNKNQESQIKEIQWHSEALRRNEIKELDRSVKIIEEDRKELETHFAKGSDIVPFLDTIEGLAKKTGAQGEVTSVDIAKDHSGLVVGMNASGTFDTVYKFLTLLENSPYELEFMRVEINKQPVKDGENKSATGPAWDIILEMKLLSFIE